MAKEDTKSKTMARGGRGMTKYFGAHCIPSLHARTKFWIGKKNAEKHIEKGIAS